MMPDATLQQLKFARNQAVAAVLSYAALGAFFFRADLTFLGCASILNAGMALLATYYLTRHTGTRP